MKRTDLRNIIREELGKVLEADTAQKIRNYVDRIRKLNDKISKSNNPEERRKLTQVKVKAEQDRQKLVKGIGAKPLKEGLEYGIIDKLIKVKLLKEMHLTNVAYDNAINALKRDGSGSLLTDLTTAVRTLISELEDYNFKNPEIKEFVLLYLDRNINAGIKFR